MKCGDVVYSKTHKRKGRLMIECSDKYIVRFGLSCFTSHGVDKSDLELVAENKGKFIELYNGG